MTMHAHIARIYAGTTDKGRAILAALYRADDALTRRDIAHQLAQRKLYPHDDRALQRLVALGLVYQTFHRIRDDMVEMYQDESIYQLRQIWLYTRYYRYRLNPSARPTIRALLILDGRHSPDDELDFGIIGAAIDAVMPLLARLVR